MEKNKHIYIMQILLVCGITFGSQNLDLNNKHVWAASIARNVLYILTIQTLKGVCVVGYTMYRKNQALDAKVLDRMNRHHVMMFLACVAFLVLSEQNVLDRSIYLIILASLVTDIPNIVKKKDNKITMNYAMGMACSYFEGYLVHVLPSDGARFFGFLENIRAYEDNQGVVFPVKKLFIVVTKSLYSPPALKDYNKSDRNDVARIEACSALSTIQKDVAGVKDRTYKNTAYKIYRPTGRPVCLSVEGGTPLATLFRVLRNRDLSEELEGLDREEVVKDFLTSLRKIIDKSPECRGKCELIYFDDTDRNLNLADVLLDRIRELEPNFEEIIAERR
ncbi:stimulator of interferon genes protein homolog [Helicoverpa armigera]|uniref:stimulator of interferon genes protein homolog n=1 Tax=Helicoverpa armigera TaxID=29058 RepID=UPI003083A814